MYAVLFIKLSSEAQRATRIVCKWRLLIAGRSLRRCFADVFADIREIRVACQLLRLVPLSARAEATVPEYPETYHRGIHRRPILSRDFAERHARKVADMYIKVYMSMRVPRVR